MKVEFDNLTLSESQMLHTCLIQFRAGQPFAWPLGAWEQKSQNGQVPTNRVVDSIREEL